MLSEERKARQKLKNLLQQQAIQPVLLLTLLTKNYKPMPSIPMPVFYYLKFYFKSPCATAPVFLRKNLKFYYNSAGLRTSPLERGGWRQGAKRGVFNWSNTPPP